MNRKTVLALAFLCMTLSAAACGHKPAPYAPDQSRFDVVSMDELSDRQDQATLQVMIVYGASSSNHVALRIFSPLEGTIFWDPAGYYGRQGSQKADRINDVLIDDAPSLKAYIKFRTETEFPSKLMEMFEWHLTVQQANIMRNILIKGSGPVLPAPGVFRTKGAGLFCGSDISNFLEQAAGDIMTVKQVFFPDALEKQLYEQSPANVYHVWLDPQIVIKKLVR